MDSGFYRGTNSEQDGRFSDKEKKLLKTMKFESVLDTKVNLAKVNMEVIKPWITGKINEIMGDEDDVLIEYCFTQLEDVNVNPKIMQINLTGFLNARMAREFMAELWQLFIDAQQSPDGIPSSIVDKKMKELKMSSTAKSSTQNDTERATHQSSSLVKSTESDWDNRYRSLTGGRYGKDSASNVQAEKNSNSRRSTSPVRYRRDYEREASDRRRSDRPSRDRERSPDRDRRSRVERDRHSSRDRERDRSRDRDGNYDRHRTRDRSEREERVRDRESRDRDRERRERKRDKERERSTSRNHTHERSRKRNRSDNVDESAAEPVAHSDSLSPKRDERSGSSKPRSPPDASPHSGSDFVDDEEEEHHRKLVYSKVVVRKYSDDETNLKSKSEEKDSAEEPESEPEENRRKRKRRKEHRHGSDSDDGERKKSKKHKKEKRRKHSRRDD